jgi:hypothetical protein
MTTMKTVELEGASREVASHDLNPNSFVQFLQIGRKACSCSLNFKHKSVPMCAGLHSRGQTVRLSGLLVLWAC